MRIAETPVFQAAMDRQERSRVPFVDLLRSQGTVLLAAMPAVAIMGAATVWFAVRSDRVGRKRLCMASAVLAAVWAFPLFRVRFRYSGASFAYSASGIIGGGTARSSRRTCSPAPGRARGCRCTSSASRWCAW